MASQSRAAEARSEDERRARAKGALAVLAGWLLPGLGHVLVGRARRGLLFGAIIVGSFTLGLAHSGRFALSDPKQPFLSTLQVVANLGVGPADTVARWVVYGTPAYFLRRESAYPAHAEHRNTLRRRAKSVHSIYGTAYLWTAGLMNLMILFDVWDLSTGRKT